MEPVAIIGMACRFPGSPSPEAFWALLRDGRSAIGKLPPGRWDAESLYDPEPTAPGKHNALLAGYLDRIDEFDARFFGISPREAAWMDPQQRFALEVAAEALEDAGLSASALAGSKTGVFLGATSNDQAFQIGRSEILDGISDVYAAMGTALNLISGRISYVFDLKGPNLVLDAACASSLLTVHLACQSLSTGDSTIAIAGGVMLMCSPAPDILLAKTRAFASDGLCKAFDARADGYVRGEGAGMVVLKPLRQALADRDRIHAVIAGSAVVQDGRSNGLTAPNGRAQEQLIREALRSAGISARQLGYVEAHGTGTALGDPIEMTALGNALLDDRDPQDKCPVGSVKTNIGHLEAAAGVAGLIKVVLALKHRELPPSLNFETANPQIPFDALPVRVQTELGPWPAAAGQLYAGVSSFGWSGTNCHVVLTEAPPSTTDAAMDARDQRDADPQLLTISAASPDALRALAASFQAYLSRPDSAAIPALRDIAFSAAVRRTHHAHRLAVVGSSHEEMAANLDAFLRDEARPGVASGRKPPSRAPKVVFVFSGHGSEWLGMGRELLQRESVFHAAMVECDRAIQAHAGFSIMAELHADEEHSRLHWVDVVQPVLFAMQVSLAALWRSLGVQPSAVIGQSMGEVAAACCAGALDVHAGARIICHRSRLLQTLIGTGAMAFVELGLDQASEAIAGREDRVAIAASSGRRATVLSGDATALGEILTALEARGVFCRLVKNANAAGHSPRVEPLLPELRQALEGLTPRAADVPFLSTVTADWHQGSALTADYWARNLRETVRFSAGLERLATAGHDVFLEVSPHGLLCSLIDDDLRELQRKGATVPSMRRNAPEQAGILAALGQLYCLGVPIEGSRATTLSGARFVSLPRYPWQRTRFPILAAQELEGQRAAAGHGSSRARPLVGAPLDVAGSQGTTVWEVFLDRRLVPALFDCRMDGSSLLPPSVYIEIARAIAADVFATEACSITELFLHRPLVLSADGPSPRLQAVLSRTTGRDSAVSIYSRSASADPWSLHASFQLRPAPDRDAPSLSAVPRQWHAAELPTSGDALYRQLGALGVQHGPSLQSIVQLACTGHDVVAELALPAAAITAARHFLQPAMLDGCIQLCDQLVLANLDDARDHHSFVGTAIAAVQVFGSTTPRMSACARLVVRTAGRFEVDVTLYNDSGEAAVEIVGVRFQRLDATLSRAPARAPEAVAESPASPSMPVVSERLRGASSSEERLAIVLACVVAQLARVLKCSPDEIDAQQQLMALGLDSLMALEVRKQLENALGLSLPAAIVLRYPTIEAIAEHLVERWEGRQSSAGAQVELAPALATSSATMVTSDLEPARAAARIEPT